MPILSLNAAETATLLMVSAAVSDILTYGVTDDVMDELKAIQPDLDSILYKDESPLH